MASKPKADLLSVEDFLYELGPVKKEVITFRRVEFEVATFKNNIEIFLDHPGSMTDLNYFKAGVFKELIGNFAGLQRTTDRVGYKILKMPGGGIISFEVEEAPEGSKGKGVIPTRIQEEGSTIVFNRALRDNKVFTAGKDDKILVNGKTIENDDVYKTLLKLFGPKWQPRLDEWIWTYYQQQKEMLKEYSGRQWDEFRYDNQSFVKFFEKHMKNLRRDHDPKVAAGRYETWNPSDVWAVRGMNNVKDKIKTSITPKHQHLLELNGLLIELMESEELVGISLKKVNVGSAAQMHLHNVDTSGVLKSLNAYSKLERYGMNDIKFEYNNIWEGDAVTTTVKIGPTNEYKINITRSGNNLSFNTAIKRTPAAQGGQAPVDMVLKMLKGKEFKKSHTSYPQTPEKLVEESAKYEKMYKFVTKKVNGAPTYNEFQLSLDEIYKKKKKNAVAKLMHLAFWYDALTNYSSNDAKSAEFWTDLLYTGMKVTAKGEFAPHAKIS
jgi:hypothetical protein